VGIIFYDRGFIADGWRYLEAAPVETEVTVAKWGTYKKNVPGTGAVIGSGKRNTQFIIDKLKQLNESGCAAQLCESLNFNGYKNWFLPGKEELDLMYKNLKQKGLGGFSINWYWSSSQGDKHYVGKQRFSDGREGYYGKGGYGSVRAVRAL